MSQQIDEILDTEYSQAGEFYAAGEPMYIGRLTLAVVDCELPLDVRPIYNEVSAAIARDPHAARLWARYFGAVNVSLALDGGPTRFEFESRDARPNQALRAEVSTRPTYQLGQIIRAADIDAPVTYLLADNDQAITAEMALIQLLHMVDTAMATGQYDRLPTAVRRIGIEQLLELKQRDPKLFLRTYGNSRNLANVPRLLGAVIPTAELERSGAVTSSLDPSLGVEVRATRPLEVYSNEGGERTAFMAITTAKKPHIGHAFLMVQALAQQPTVTLELNDQGPRVDQAVARLADVQNISLAQAAQRVSQPGFSLDTLEASYRTRDQAPVITQAMPPYSLTSANAYYRGLLATVMPRGRAITAIADSELDAELAALRAAPGYRALFGASGMAVVEGVDGQAVVVEAGARLRVAGIIAALATQRALDICDRPQPISQREREALSSGLERKLRQRNGNGVMFNFEVASGTNGKSITLEDLIARVARQGHDPKLLLPAIRRLLDVTPSLGGPGRSTCPNFASTDAFLRIFDTVLAEVAGLPNPDALLDTGIRYKGVLRAALRSLSSDIYADRPRESRLTGEEGRRILSQFPYLRRQFSKAFIDYVECCPDLSLKIPKNISTEHDRKLVGMVRYGTPDRFLPI